MCAGRTQGVNGFQSELPRMLFLSGQGMTPAIAVSDSQRNCVTMSVSPFDNGLMGFKRVSFGSYEECSIHLGETP